MHAGSLDSPRLKAIHDALHSAPDGCTTLELQRLVSDMAPATTVSELRQHGLMIDCQCEGVKNGRRIYRYRLLAQTDAHGQLVME